MPKFLGAAVPAVALGLAVLACHVSAPQPAGLDSRSAPAPAVGTATSVAVTPVIATATPVATASAPPSPSATPIRTPAPTALVEPSVVAVSAVREIMPGVARLGEPTVQPVLTAQANRATPAAQPTRGTEPASAATALSVPTGRVGTDLYLVKPGDTLSAIAGRHRVTVEAIARANGLDDRDFIRAGQSLRLP